MTGDELLKSVLESASEGIHAVESAAHQIDAARVAAISTPPACPAHTIIEGAILSQGSAIKSALKCHTATADFLSNGGLRGVVTGAVRDAMPEPTKAQGFFTREIKEFGVGPLKLKGVRYVDVLLLVILLAVFSGRIPGCHDTARVTPDAVRQGIEAMLDDELATAAAGTAIGGGG